MTGAATVGICVNSSDDFVSDGQCHLIAKRITRYDATFKSCLIFSPEHLSLKYAEQIIPPTISGVLISSAGTPGLSIHLCLLKPGVKEVRENETVRVRKWE